MEQSLKSFLLHPIIPFTPPNLMAICTWGRGVGDHGIRMGWNTYVTMYTCDNGHSQVKWDDGIGWVTTSIPPVLSLPSHYVLWHSCCCQVFLTGNRLLLKETPMCTIRTSTRKEDLKSFTQVVYPCEQELNARPPEVLNHSTSHSKTTSQFQFQEQ